MLLLPVRLSLLVSCRLRLKRSRAEVVPGLSRPAESMASYLCVVCFLVSMGLLAICACLSYQGRDLLVLPERSIVLIRTGTEMGTETGDRHVTVGGLSVRLRLPSSCLS